MHGWTYKEPFSFDNSTSIVTTTVLDDAVNVFLPDLNIDQLDANEQTNARNLTSAILSLPQSDVQLEFYLQVLPGQNFTSTNSWTARLIWPKLTDSRGEFDGFNSIPVTPPGETTSWLPDGSSSTEIVRLDVHTNVTDTGNSSAYLVPPEGIIILSDIDDVLRVTKIWDPSEGLLNSFARNFTPWDNMPDRFAEWSQQSSAQPYHFHYLTTTPEQATTKYMDFIYSYYPMGSFDTRPLNFTTVDQTFNVRKTLLDKIMQTFPQRKFILLGDTSNGDVMSEYPAVAKQYGNVQCILIRNSSATDSTDTFPYNTEDFKDLDSKTFMFFRTPDDLAGLNFANGDCVNSSVSFDVTYGWQGLPFGVTSGADGNGGRGARPSVEKVWWVLMAAAVAVWLG
jgi:phosphatidate phosphatase APP1